MEMENATGTDQRDGSAVAGSADVDVQGFLDRSLDQVTQAQSHLRYSNKQEAQFASEALDLASSCIRDALAALRQGKRGSEAAHGEAAQDGPA